MGYLRDTLLLSLSHFGHDSKYEEWKLEVWALC